MLNFRIIRTGKTERLIMQLFYSTGFRVSELINLKKLTRLIFQTIILKF